MGEVEDRVHFNVTEKGSFLKNRAVREWEGKKYE
jgi:hypothetical protein